MSKDVLGIQDSLFKEINFGMGFYYSFRCERK